MTSLFLDEQSKARLAEWLAGIESIPGCNNGRLGMLQLAGSEHITIKELVAISNFMPDPISNIIMDTDYRIKELPMP